MVPGGTVMGQTAVETAGELNVTKALKTLLTREQTGFCVSVEAGRERK